MAGDEHAVTHGGFDVSFGVKMLVPSVQDSVARNELRVINVVHPQLTQKLLNGVISWFSTRCSP